MKYNPDGWNFWTIVAATIYILLIIAIAVLSSAGLLGAFQW